MPACTSGAASIIAPSRPMTGCSGSQVTGKRASSTASTAARLRYAAPRWVLVGALAFAGLAAHRGITAPAGTGVQQLDGVLAAVAELLAQLIDHA